MGKVYSLRRLLPMKYHVAEIAACLGVTADTMHRTYLPAGAPVVRDATGQIWIIGTEFAAWAKTYLAASKLKNKTMNDNQAYCSSCHRVCEMVNPRVTDVNQHGVANVAAKCGLCGARVRRFMKKARDEQHGDGKADQPAKL